LGLTKAIQSLAFAGCMVGLLLSQPQSALAVPYCVCYSGFQTPCCSQNYTLCFADGRTFLDTVHYCTNNGFMCTSPIAPGGFAAFKCSGGTHCGDWVFFQPKFSTDYTVGGCPEFQVYGNHTVCWCSVCATGCTTNAHICNGGNPAAFACLQVGKSGGITFTYNAGQLGFNPSLGGGAFNLTPAGGSAPEIDTNDAALPITVVLGAATLFLDRRRKTASIT
jgi:hypothetical protein